MVRHVTGRPVGRNKLAQFRHRGSAFAEGVIQHPKMGCITPSAYPICSADYLESGRRVCLTEWATPLAVNRSATRGAVPGG